MVSCFGGSCPDYLAPFNKKIKYREGDILTFTDSLNNLKYDTILQVHLDKADYSRAEDAKGDYNYDDRVCDATSFVKFSNLFYIYIYQHSAPKIKGLLGYIEPGGYGYWNHNEYYAYKESFDTIKYTFNNKTYEALKYSYSNDTVHSEIWNLQTELTKQNNYIYHDYTFIYEDDIKLVEYTTRDKTGIKKTWKLRE